MGWKVSEWFSVAYGCNWFLYVYWILCNLYEYSGRDVINYLPDPWQLLCPHSCDSALCISINAFHPWLVHNTKFLCCQLNISYVRWNAFSYSIRGGCPAWVVQCQEDSLVVVFSIWVSPRVFVMSLVFWSHVIGVWDMSFVAIVLIVMCFIGSTPKCHMIY